MSYYLYLVETKKEYTMHLINALTPLIYEGISSIYDDAKTNSPNEELKLFQSLLRKIPTWNDHLIEQETNRIVKQSSKGDIIEDLIKAVIKSNIMILTNTPPDKKDNIKIKHDITTAKFIHNSYIEVARNIFQNPYLFYHKYNSFELKKNQRESNEIIKKSIEQSIRKLLPMNIILQNYLGSSFEGQSDDFHNSIPETDYNNLKHMLNKDPINDETYQLVKKNDSIKSPTIINQENGMVNINISAPKQKTNIETSDNFKNLKELAKLNNITENLKTENLKTENKKESDLKTDKKESDLKTENKKESDLKTENKKDSDFKTENKKDSDFKTDKKDSDFKTKNKKDSDLKTENKKDSDLKTDKKDSDSNKNIKPEIQKTKVIKQINVYNQQSESIKDSDYILQKNKITYSNHYEDSEDASVSYFKQLNSKEGYAEVYDDTRTKPIMDNYIDFKNPEKKSTKINKPFINLDRLDDNSSINFKSIMGDVSSVNNQSLINNNNKKKYFNKNNNL
jgi:hypothetical protein